MRRLMMSSASARLFQAVLVSACDVLCIASGVVRYFRQCWLERPLNAWSFGRRLVRRTRHTGFVPFGAFVGAELGGLTRHGHLPRRGQRSLHTEGVLHTGCEVAFAMDPCPGPRLQAHRMSDRRAHIFASMRACIGGRVLNLYETGRGSLT